jgi:16S rRNA (adenine1518-N6/adenine1519-N6)-dimethyltransferase
MKHVPRKRFGQNFLIDPAVVRDIVMAIDPRPGDTLFEIGPGLGALTRPLVHALEPSCLHVVELDRDLALRLRQSKNLDRLVVHEADALRFDFVGLYPDANRIRIVGNLPYNISSPLLFHLLEQAQRIVDQHFMLQREVVLRMVAAPGESAYGRLSVMLQVHYRMALLFEVPPSAFDPPPKVHSALVRMVPRHDDALVVLDRVGFGRLVAQAFSQRRKMLRNTLARYDQFLPMSDYGLSPTVRAEDVSPETYVSYANALARHAVKLGQSLPLL